MKIYADDNMPLAREFFAELGDVTLFSGRNVQAAELADADILLVRSITKVNAALLDANPNLRFVGTATIGTDHLDLAYLQGRGIVHTNAPGCNAQSVVEYVLSCLFILAEQQDKPLTDFTVGVVGVGQIGKRLVAALQALGLTVLQNDPLRAAEADFPHLDLDTLLASADVVSLHVPLVRGGAYPTFHLLDANRLAALPATTALINACRGEVVDNQALLAQARAGVKRPLFLDVWEQEPAIEQQLVPYCDIATAHIAGHSVEGKARGTEMLYQAVCQLLDVTPTRTLSQFLPSGAIEKLQISPNFRLLDVQNLCRMLYDVRRDDALFRQHLVTHGFDWLRKTYPPRREFSSVCLQGQVPDYLIRLGFSQK